MSAKKRFVAPVYWIVISVLVSASFMVPRVINVMKMKKTAASDILFQFRESFIDQLVNQGLVLVFLLAECLIYWYVGHRVTRKDFAWGHVAGIMLALIGLPLGFLIHSYFIDISIPSEENTHVIKVMNALDRGLFEVFLILAHICLVLVLLDVFKKRKVKSNPLTEAGPDILSDYQKIK